MELIQISNKNRKVLINSEFDNMACRPRSLSQIKRLKNVYPANIPAWPARNKSAYACIVQKDAATVYAIVIFYPIAYSTPPLIAVALPSGYNFSVSWQVSNSAYTPAGKPATLLLAHGVQFMYVLSIRKNDGGNISTDEVYAGLNLYIYDFLTPQQRLDSYGATQRITINLYIGGRPRYSSWHETVQMFVDEGAERGLNGYGAKMETSNSGKPRPNLKTISQYPGINDTKAGLQVYGFHRFWKEKYHSPKLDARTEEEKQAQGKLEQYSADILYDSRVPYLVVTDPVDQILQVDGYYKPGDIYKIHQDYKSHPHKVAVIVNSVVDGIAIGGTSEAGGFPEYQVRQGIAFSGDTGVGTIETETKLPFVSTTPGLFIGSKELSYLTVNVDGVTPNTVDEFE